METGFFARGAQGIELSSLCAPSKKTSLQVRLPLIACYLPLICACTTAVTTPTADAIEALIGCTAGRLPRPATAHPGPSLPTTHPGGALAGLGTHGSAGRGRWQRHLVAGVVGGGGVRGRHGHHHGHPHRRRQNTTTRPSLCVAHSPRGCMWSLSIAHTRGTPIGAHGRSYTLVLLLLPASLAARVLSGHGTVVTQERPQRRVV